MLPRQKLALTNEINTLHGLSTVMELQLCHNVFSGRQHLMELFDDCIPRRQLVSCSVTRPSLCVGVTCKTIKHTGQLSRHCSVCMISFFTTVSEQIVMYIAVDLQYAEFTSVVVKLANIRLLNF